MNRGINEVSVNGKRRVNTMRFYISLFNFELAQIEGNNGNNINNNNNVILLRDKLVR